MMNPRLLRLMTAALGVVLAFSVSALAGTTGKLSGRVLDAKKEPLPSANILLNGTTLGGVTDIDGYYAILNIPPGTYTVQARLVGYRSAITKNVIITVNNTTKLDLMLEDESITTEAVVVTATRPVVEVGATSTVATISDSDIKKLPVQELSDIVNLQAGVVDGHFRGGRAGEVQYQVNGVSVNNVYNNQSTVLIDRSLIQEVQVITGTFDAEYGQAMSGVVNTVLKSGGESFVVDGEVLAGSFLYGSGGKRNLTFKFRPATTQNYQLSLSGPAGLPQTSFLVSARRYVFDDYFYGTRTFRTTDTNNFETQTPHGTGDGSEVAMAYTREWSGIVKITNKSLPSIELSYSALGNLLERRYLDGAFTWRLNPDGRPIARTTSLVHGFDWTHTLSPSTFYNISVRQNYFDYRYWLYDDFYDTRYDSAGASKSFNYLYYGGVVQGVDFSRSRQRTNSYLVKGSVTSQVNRSNLIKIGGEFQGSKMEFGAAGTLVYEDVNGTQTLVRYVNSPPAYPGVQIYYPVSGAAFAQDMVEWNDLTIRAGVRAEYFNGRSTVPGDLANPANVIPGAPVVGSKKTTAKFSTAPRLGVSYPVTDRSSIYFSYGHFYQLPNLGDMYSNSDYSNLSSLQAGSTSYTTVYGNPDVKPEKTVQYEFGYKNAITDNLGLSVNLYYKDIRDLLGTQFVTTYTGAEYARLANIDFGNVTGFTISVDQRRIGRLGYALDYTWQMAQGNSSDPTEAASRAEAGEDARPTSVPFSWDQRHTINLTVEYTEPDDYSMSAIMRYASGQPYTPSIGSGYGSQIERNSGRKPSGFLTDLRVEKHLKLADWNVTLFARVFNLFNATYFNGSVFANTGSPDYSLTPETDRASLADPTRYYSPRRVEVGVSLNSTL